METSFQSIGGLGQGTALANKSIRPSAHTQVVEKFGQSLSESQKSSILNTINVLERDGESFEEIREVVDGFLEDNGITPPSQIGRSLPSTGPLSNKGVISQLTQDKLSTILDEVSSLKQAQASFDEIKERVDSFLKENNVKPPNLGGTFVDVLT
jgi:methionine aminopeptidase